VKLDSEHANSKIKVMALKLWSPNYWFKTTADKNKEECR
jgi:hypothetical protein